MTLGMVRDIRVDLESYSVNALRSMVRARSEQWRELRLRAELLAELRLKLFDVSSIRHAIDDCDECALEALWLLRERDGVMSVAAMRGQLATWHPDRPVDQIHRIPNGLVRRALGFWRSLLPRYGANAHHDISGAATDSPNSTEIFTLAEILACLPSGIEPPEVSLAPVGPPAVVAPSTLPVRQILAILRAIEERSPRVLRSGVIASRDRRAIALAVDPDSAEHKPLDGRTLPIADDGGALVDFLRSVLEGAGYVRVTHDRHLQTTGASQGFVAMPPHEQVRTLLDAWLRAGENILSSLAHLEYQHRTSGSSVPDDDRVRGAYRRIVDAVRDNAHYGLWYDVSDLSRLLRHCDVEFLVPWLGTSWQAWHAAYEHDGLAPPIYSGIALQDSRGRSRWLIMGTDWDLVEGAFIRAVVKGPLTWLGVVISQLTSTGREIFTLTRPGARALGVEAVDEPFAVAEADAHLDALIVQPNFDVVVYQPSDRPELIYQIDRFAERVSVDRLAVYRLTREAFYAGLQLGVTVDNAIELLQRASRAGVPQNVDVTLRDWARQFDSVRWTRNACLLEAPDSATLDRWLELEAISSAVDRRLSPTIVLIDGSVASGLVGSLSSHNVDVRMVDANSPLRAHAYARNVTDIDVEPADLNLYLRESLGRIAEPVAEPSGRVVFRLSPGAVESGIARGLSVDQILADLDAVLGGHVPPGLRVRVKGWAGGFPPASVSQVAVISTRDAMAFRELRSDPDLARLFLLTISSTSALVTLADVERLRDALTCRGIQISEESFEILASASPGESKIPVGALTASGREPINRTPTQIRQVAEGAIASRHLLALEYRDDVSGVTSSYLVDPRAVHLRDGSYVLDGYCPRLNDNRTFRIAQIMAIRLRAQDDG